MIKEYFHSKILPFCQEIDSSNIREDFIFIIVAKLIDEMKSLLSKSKDYENDKSLLNLIANELITAIRLKFVVPYMNIKVYDIINSIV